MIGQAALSNGRTQDTSDLVRVRRGRQGQLDSTDGQARVAAFEDARRQAISRRARLHDQAGHTMLQRVARPLEGQAGREADEPQASRKTTSGEVPPEREQRLLDAGQVVRHGPLDQIPVGLWSALVLVVFERAGGHEQQAQDVAEPRGETLAPFQAPAQGHHGEVRVEGKDAAQPVQALILATQPAFDRPCGETSAGKSIPQGP